MQYRLLALVFVACTVCQALGDFEGPRLFDDPKPSASMPRQVKFTFDVTTGQLTNSGLVPGILLRDSAAEVTVTNAAPGSKITLSFQPGSKDAKKNESERVASPAPSVAAISLNPIEKSLLSQLATDVQLALDRANLSMANLKGVRSEENRDEVLKELNTLASQVVATRQRRSWTLQEAEGITLLLAKIEEGVNKNVAAMPAFMKNEGIKPLVIQVDGLMEDGTLTVSVVGAEKDAKPVFGSRHLKVAKRERVVAELSSEIAFLPRSPKTFVVTEIARDATHKTAVVNSRAGDPKFETNLAGGIQFVFDEESEKSYRALLKVATLGLYNPDGNRFGLYLGGSLQVGSQDVGASIGITWFLNRELTTSINYGLAFRNTDELLESYKVGSSFSRPVGEDFPLITRSKLRPIFFISFKYKP